MRSCAPDSYISRHSRQVGNVGIKHTQRAQLVSTAHMASIITFQPPQRRRETHFLWGLLQWSSMNRCFNVLGHSFILRCLIRTNGSVAIVCSKQSDSLQTHKLYSVFILRGLDGQTDRTRHLFPLQYGTKVILNTNVEAGLKGIS